MSVHHYRIRDKLVRLVDAQRWLDEPCYRVAKDRDGRVNEDRLIDCIDQRRSSAEVFAIWNAAADPDS